MSMKEVSRQLAELTSQLNSFGSRFDGIDAKIDGLNSRLGRLESKVETLDTKVDEGFNASKVRDEELMGLMKFGLEAREALRESMENRFDEADRKHNQQIDLLNDAVRYLNSHK